MFTKQRFTKHAQLRTIKEFQESVKGTTTMRPYLPYLRAHITFLHVNDGAVIIYYNLPSGETFISSFYYKDPEYLPLINHGPLPRSPL